MQVRPLPRLQVSLLIQRAAEAARSADGVLLLLLADLLDAGVLSDRAAALLLLRLRLRSDSELVLLLHALLVHRLSGLLELVESELSVTICAGSAVRE